MSEGVPPNREASGEWRGRDAGAAGSGRGQPTFLSRLRKVLAGVRGSGSGGRKQEVRQTRRLASHEQSESDVNTGILDATDRKVYQDAVSQLHSSQPLSLRLSVLEELCELCRVYNFEDLPAIWAMMRDLLSPEQDVACKDRAVAFIGALSAGENFNRLGLVRLEMFSIIQEGGSSLGLHLQLKALMYITQNAQACTPFEEEVCGLLVSWLLKLASDIKDVQAPALRQKHKELLTYAASFFKFASTAVREASLQELTSAVCTVLECSFRKEDGPEGPDTWTLHKGCLNSLDVVARYTVPSMVCITRCVDALCWTVNEASFSRDSWLVMKNILTGDHFIGAFNHLIDILHEPTSEGQASSVRSHSTDQLLGAVFFVSMSSWGSSRIENMQYPRQSILTALFCAVMSGQKVICEEVLLSVQRLLRKFGSTLRFEWATVFDIIQRICQTLDILSLDPVASPAVIALPRAGSAADDAVGGGGALQTLKEVLTLIDEQHSALKFQGLESDYFRLVTIVKGHVADDVALKALAYYVERIHPAHSGWLTLLSEMMDGFYAQHVSSTVRVAALEALHELLNSYGLMYELEITDAAVVPFLHALPLESDALVWGAALKVLVGLAMRMQCDRFEAIIQLLQAAGTEAREQELRLAAVRGLLSVLPATMRHLPTSRFTSLWNLLLGMLQRTGRDSAEIKVEILEMVTSMSVTSKYRPRLVRPGQPDVVCPLPIIVRRGQGKGEGGVHEDRLDTSRLFACLTRIIDSEQDQRVFAVAAAGLVRGLQNHIIFEGEDIHGLVSILTHRLRSCSWGPRPSSKQEPHSSSDAATRNSNYEVGLQLLGLAVCGWISVLPASDGIEAVDAFVKGLHSAHNCSSSEPAPSLSSLVADRPGIVRVIKRNGGVASVCINKLALIAVLIPDVTTRHLPRVLDVMEALTSEPDQAQLVLHGVQYMKYIAGQLPQVRGGVTVRLQERALRVMLAFMNTARWGVLIANLSHRALALWYLHSNHSLRENLVSTVDQCVREDASMKSDPLCAIMLDWLMRNASADFQTSAPPHREWMEPIFRRPGVKCKAFAFGDSILSIRSTPLGLVDMASRRPTDMKRWIIYRQPPTQTGHNLKPSIDGILQLLTSSLEVSKVSDVDIDYHDDADTDAAAGGEAEAAEKAETNSGQPVGGRDAVGLTSASGEHPEGAPGPPPEAAATTAGARAAAGRQAETGSVPHVPPESVNSATVDTAHPAVESELRSQQPAGTVSGQRSTPSGDAVPEARAEREQDEEETVLSDEAASEAEAEAMQHFAVQHEIPAVDPLVMLMQWLRGPFGDTEFTHTPAELRFNDALERAIRLLDRTPLTFTHKFGILYIAPDQRSESEFLKNAGGSALYESFVRKLGHYMPLADCGDDVFTGGLDKSAQKRDGEIALFWRNSLAQCIFFVGTLMPNEGTGEQVNKKRFIGNTYVKVVYTDSDHWFTLSWLSGQFNLIVIVVAPLEPGYFRLTVMRDPSVPVIGPVTDVVVVPESAVATVVRRMLIDADVATMIAAAGGEHYSSNWQERLKQIRQMNSRHAIVETPKREDRD